MSGTKTSGPAARRAVRSWLVMLSGCMAVLAAAGAIGLATGVVPLDQAGVTRLPWHSTAFGAVALLLVVAAPMTVLAVMTHGDHPAWGRVAVAAGALLVGWIAAEIAVIQELSWLQVIFAVIGVVVLWVGLRHIGPPPGHIVR